MTTAIISVEDLGKRYTIRHEPGRPTRGYRRLSEDLVSAAKAPFRAIASRVRGGAIPTTVSGLPSTEDFWALRDLSFDVNEGEILGIIGRNGAGKSTLLKILSRITSPSEGRVRIRGRVASLLEVGTGFHPELTGRENIYLNGAILGMSRVEMRRRFDEIVEFSGVENFLDTPVKRYSSGMYVRLAFAVAAHLDPEILLVDEVLAVGDAQFQKKCLGKMQEVSMSRGRTVLFVSHNMAMISSLCGRAILMQDGALRTDGTPGEVIIAYSTGSESSPFSFDYRGSSPLGDSNAQLLAGAVVSESGKPAHEVSISDALVVCMDFRVTGSTDVKYVPNFHFYRPDGSCAFISTAANVEASNRGDYRAECRIPANFLNDGLYSVGLGLSSFESGVNVHFFDQGALVFNVRDPIEGSETRSGYAGVFPGALRPRLDWTIRPITEEVRQ